jgi:hypothetical protein
MKRLLNIDFLKELLGEKEDMRFRPRGNVLTETQKTRFRRPRKSFSFNSNVYLKFGKLGYRTSDNFSSSKQCCYFHSSHRYEKLLNKKHLEYIQKEGKGLNGTDPILYGADPENYEKRMSKLSFRWRISPENQNVDLDLLVKELIRRVEWSTGYKLNWVAANHYNTDHKHAHILINGFDLNRQKVQFDKDYMKNVFRDTLQDICTELVGPHTDEEKELSYQKQTTSDRFNSLDKRLETILKNSNGISSYQLSECDNNSLLHKRLLHLKNLDLVNYDHNNETFTFSPDWKDQLKIYGKYNTYLDGLYFTKAHQSRYSLHEIDKIGPVSGKVIRRYFMQEDSNNHAVVLETKPGHYSYVPLFEAPVNASVGSNIKIDYQRVATSTGGTRKIVNITNL